MTFSLHNGGENHEKRELICYFSRPRVVKNLDRSGLGLGHRLYPTYCHKAGKGIDWEGMFLAALCYQDGETVKSALIKKVKHHDSDRVEKFYGYYV